MNLTPRSVYVQASEPSGQNASSTMQVLAFLRRERFVGMRRFEKLWRFGGQLGASPTNY